MKKAIVTGHSRGLGKALLEQLEAGGWGVLGISRSVGTDPATSVQLDLASPEAVADWLAGPQLGAFLTGATEIVLLNNAGALGPARPVGGADPVATITAVNLNVTAPILLTDAVIEARPEGADLRVAHISSGAGRRPLEGWAVYCATKAAVDMHARTLAAERHDGVRVAAVAPGIVDTDMQAAIRSSGDFPDRATFIEYKETGQLASPEDAAAKVLALVAAPTFGDEPVARV